MMSKMKNMGLSIVAVMKEHKKKLIVLVLAVVLVAGGVLFYPREEKVPTLTLVSPKDKITVNTESEVIIPAVLSALPDELFSAASVVISFDKNKLEFVGMKIGTMQTYDDYDETKDEEKRYKNPEWSYNVELANQEGEIRAMYLDMTAGKNSYSLDGYQENVQDIPFQLVFKVKDSVIKNEELTISIEEAVFATINGDVDKTTLSTKDNYSTLRTSNAIIKAK